MLNCYYYYYYGNHFFLLMQEFATEESQRYKVFVYTCDFNGGGVES